MAVVVMLLVKEIGWRGAPFIAISALLCAVSLVLPSLKSSQVYLLDISEAFGITEITKTVLKLIGLGYLIGIVVDILKDMGEGLIAKSVLLVGRIEIIVIAMPYFFEVVKIGVSLI